MLGERADELLRVAVGLEGAPVADAEAVAQLAHAGADVLEILREREVHLVAVLATLAMSSAA